MTFTNYLENSLLNLVFGVGTFSKPATVYVGLCTSVAEDGAITGEPTGNGYARVAVTNNDASTWAASTVGSKTNANAVVTFPECTGGNWGELATVFISDAESGNTNTLVYSTLTTAKTINVGDTAKFNTSTLTITLD